MRVRLHYIFLAFSLFFFFLVPVGMIVLIFGTPYSGDIIYTTDGIESLITVEPELTTASWLGAYLIIVGIVFTVLFLAAFVNGSIKSTQFQVYQARKTT